MTLALPQDVQAEAYDWPVELFAERVWHVARPPAERARVAAAAEVVRAARRPMIVAGGGVHYSGPSEALRRVRRDRHPGRRDPGGQGLAPPRPPAGDGRRRLDRARRPRTPRPRGRRRDRRRHPLERLHDGLPDDLREPRRPVRQPERRRLRRGQAGRAAVVADARGGADLARRGARRLRRRRGLPRRAGRLWQQWDAEVEAAYHPPGRDRPARAGAAHPGRGAGAGQRAERPARRRALRGRVDAGRPPQAVARARPQGLPRGVRLLLHGLRGAGLARHPARRRDRDVFVDGRRRLAT